MEKLYHFLKTIHAPYIRKIRTFIMRTIHNRESYLASLSIKPISTKYGFDRGQPIDRVYIEKFLRNKQERIKGVCLEVVDGTYTKKFGGTKVTKSDVIDIFKSQKANIHGDLRNLHGVIPDNTYDTIILTQTLNVIDDYESAIRECKRILKPKGILLATLPTISPAWNLKINLWRFSLQSAKYVFKKYFESNKLEIISFGNRLSAESFWLGMSAEDLTIEELLKEEQVTPLIIGVIAVK